LRPMFILMEHSKTFPATSLSMKCTMVPFVFSLLWIIISITD
jgi:hypothetical protein